MSLQNLIIQKSNHLVKEALIQVNLVGPLTGLNGVRLSSYIQNLVQYKHVDLVIDLTSVSSIDNKGIKSLASIYKMQQNKNCSVVFNQPHESNIMDTIRPTRIHKVLPFNYNVVRTAI